MGNFTWRGWKTSAEDAPQPTSILYGANLKTSSSKGSQKAQPAAQPEQVKPADQQANKPVK